MAPNIFIVILLFACSVFAGKHDIYSRYSVHGIKLEDIEDVKFLYELETNLNLDLWQHGMPGQRDAVIMVSPEKQREFLDFLDERGLVHYLKIADVSKALEEHDQALSQWRMTRQNRMVFQDYPRYADIEEYMERMAEQYPNLVTLVNAGPSFEGRSIKYVKISTTNFNDRSKPVYFIDAMMHAREWVTAPVTLYSIFRLVESLRPQEQDLLEDIDWIILPIVNPDGYEFSHTNNRLWRRSRSFNSTVSSSCYGVDINRNFDIHFNTIGVSSDPCSDIYPGTAAFSEPETRVVRDILMEHLDRIQLYNDVHSFGNYVLFGFDNLTLPENAPQLHFVAAAMGATMDAMKLEHADYYLVGNSAMVLYAVSGSGQDYAQELEMDKGYLPELELAEIGMIFHRSQISTPSQLEDIGVPLSYTMELPSYGYDFRVPPSYMDHMNEETWQGIATSARLSRTLYESRYSNF